MNCFILTILLFVFYSSDTTYLFYQDQKPNYAVQLHKHKDDPNANNSYPFGGGRHYHVPMKSGNFIKDISFNFWSYTPDWMD